MSTRFSIGRELFVVELPNKKWVVLLVLEVPNKGWVVNITRDMEIVESRYWFDSQEQAVEFAEKWMPTEDVS